MAIESRIVDLKADPEHSISIFIREHFLSAVDHHRLIGNYAQFDPWSDPSILSLDVFLLNEAPVSFGCLQWRPFFPPGVFRANTRHYVFPEFRQKSLRKSKIGYTNDGISYGGVLIRHQIRTAKERGARGVFVSRDRGARMFTYFMKTRVNDLLEHSLPHLHVLHDRKINVCNHIASEVCWQFVAGLSFCETSFVDLISILPSRPH